MRPIRAAALLASLTIALAPVVGCSDDGSGDGPATTVTADVAAERYSELTATLNPELTGGLRGFDEALRADDPAAAAAEMERLARAYGAFADGLDAAEWPPEAAEEVARVRDAAAEAAGLAETIGTDVADDGEALAADVAALNEATLDVRASSADARAALELEPPPTTEPDSGG